PEHSRKKRTNPSLSLRRSRFRPHRIGESEPRRGARARDPGAPHRLPRCSGSSAVRFRSEVKVPMKAPAPAIRLPFRRGSVEFGLGTEADHEAVYQTLLHVFHGPDRDAYLGALGDPSYRPDQRLLVKVDGRVVSHVHLTERKIRYGSVTIPMNGVMWVGTLPE